MSTIKSITILHPSATVNNIVNDASGNVAIGGTITAATHIGGTTASSSLTLQSTSGVGTSDSILFKVGNNGATVAMTVDTSGNVGIGNPTPSAKLDISTGTTATAINSNNGLDTGFVLKYASTLTSLGNNFNQPLAFLTNNTEKMRIDASGKAMIGLAASKTYGNTLQVQGGIQNFGANSASVSDIIAYDYNSVDASPTYAGAVLRKYGSTATGNLYIASTVAAAGWAEFAGINANGLGIGTNGAAPIVFGTTATERMRIDSSGNVLVGTTSNLVTGAKVQSVSTGGIGTFASRDSSTTAGKFWNFGADSSNAFVVYNQSTAGVYIVDGANSWTGSSDERLKNITGTIKNALTKVVSLRAAEFTWKFDKTNKPQVGLIAQDVQKVLPEVVDVNAEGNFGVRYSECIPLLVAAIQELSAKNDALEARLAKLETVQ